VQGVANMLERFGVQVSATQVKMRNAASVIITADLPAFAQPGARLDVNISSLGDAKTLQGGTLIQSPLYAANGEVYAVAQGQISVGGFLATAGESKVVKNHVTAGRIPSGAIVEKAVETKFSDAQGVSILLNTPDFTTANRAAAAIIERLGAGSAVALDAATVRVNASTPSANDAVALIAQIGDIEIKQDDIAKVIVNEKTGTVVITGTVTVGTVAITQGGLTVLVQNEKQVSQPAPFSNGKTKVVDQNTITAMDEARRFQIIEEGSSLDDLVRALNAMKVTPRDVISILQAIKEAGALNADLVVI